MKAAMEKLQYIGTYCSFCVLSTWFLHALSTWFLLHTVGWEVLFFYRLKQLILNTSLTDLLFSLKSINGQQLYEGSVVNGKIIVGESLAQGTYVLTIRSKDGRVLHTGIIVKI